MTRDLSKPGDARRRWETQQAAEARLQHLLEHQRLNREEIRRKGAADALYGGGDTIISRMD